MAGILGTGALEDSQPGPSRVRIRLWQARESCSGCRRHPSRTRRWPPGCGPKTFDDLVGQRRVVEVLRQLTRFGPSAEHRALGAARKREDHARRPAGDRNQAPAWSSHVRGDGRGRRPPQGGGGGQGSPAGGPAHGALHRRDPSVQQGPAGRHPPPRRGRHRHADRRHDGEPVVRGDRAAPLAQPRFPARAAGARRAEAGGPARPRASWVRGSTTRRWTPCSRDRVATPAWRSTGWRRRPRSPARRRSRSTTSSARSSRATSSTTARATSTTTSSRRSSRASAAATRTRRSTGWRACSRPARM